MTSKPVAQPDPQMVRLIQRCEDARVLLAVHGMLRDSEIARVRRKLDAWFQTGKKPSR
jgi:hypothetical protein